MRSAITNRTTMRFRGALCLAILFLPLLRGSSHAQERDQLLEFTPVQTSITFTLGDVLHTVHGAFDLKSGTVHFNPVTGAIGGEILVDATSGRSGNSSRDGKMHREILESAHYREITFLPDRVDGKVNPQGKSSIQLHGMFGIHGASHEIMVPVEVEMTPDHWTATAHFAVPYVKWGMKNPSTFILRVNQTVDIDVSVRGALAGDQR